MPGAPLAGNRSPETNKSSQSGETFGDLFARWNFSVETEPQGPGPDGSADNQNLSENLLDSTEPVAAENSRAANSEGDFESRHAQGLAPPSPEGSRPEPPMPSGNENEEIGRSNAPIGTANAPGQPIPSRSIGNAETGEGVISAGFFGTTNAVDTVGSYAAKAGLASGFAQPAMTKTGHSPYSTSLISGADAGRTDLRAGDLVPGLSRVNTIEQITHREKLSDLADTEGSKFRVAGNPKPMTDAATPDITRLPTETMNERAPNPVPTTTIANIAPSTDQSLRLGDIKSAGSKDSRPQKEPDQPQTQGNQEMLTNLRAKVSAMRGQEAAAADLSGTTIATRASVRSPHPISSNTEVSDQGELRYNPVDNKMAQNSVPIGAANGNQTVLGIAHSVNSTVRGTGGIRPQQEFSQSQVQTNRQASVNLRADASATMGWGAAVADLASAQIVKPVPARQPHPTLANLEASDQGELRLGPASGKKMGAPVPIDAPKKSNVRTPQNSDGPAGAMTSLTVADPIAGLSADRTVPDMNADPGKLPSSPLHETIPGSAPASSATTARYETARLMAAQLADSFPNQTGKQIEIALNPEELGRVRMILSTSETGVAVSITTERPETLDLMRRHADLLSAELRRLGYEGIGFEFNGNSAGGFDHNNEDGSPGGFAEPSVLESETTTPTKPAQTAVSGGLDLRL